MRTPPMPILSPSVGRRLLHDRQELPLVDEPVLVFVELLDHRLQLLLRQVLPQFPRDLLQVAQRNAAFAFFVEELEGA